jgi:hypothetical protein
MADRAPGSVYAQLKVTHQRPVGAFVQVTMDLKLIHCPGGGCTD